MSKQAHLTSRSQEPSAPVGSTLCLTLLFVDSVSSVISHLTQQRLYQNFAIQLLLEFLKFCYTGGGDKVSHPPRFPLLINLSSKQCVFHITNIHLYPTQSHFPDSIFVPTTLFLTHSLFPFPIPNHSLTSLNYCQ